MPSYRIDREGQSFEAPDFATLRAWVEAGRVRADDKVWSQGWKEPVRAYDVSGLREIYKARGDAPGMSARGEGAHYVIDDGREQLSAPTFVDVQQLVARGRVQADDLLWSVGWESWVRAYDVSGLREIFQKRNERPAAKPRKSLPPLPSVSTTSSATSSDASPSASGRHRPQRRRDASTSRSQEATATKKPSWMSQVGETFKELNSMAKEGFERMGLLQGGAVGVAPPRRRLGRYQADPDRQVNVAPRVVQRRSGTSSQMGNVDWQKEPWRYRREQGPFALSDLLSADHLQSYLSFRRHRGVEIPIQRLMPQMVPDALLQSLVPDARRLGQRDALVSDLVAQISSFLALPQSIDVFVSSEEEWEMSLLGGRKTSQVILLGEAWLSELSELGLAGLLAQILAQVYLQDAPLRTLAWLLWKPEDLPRVGIHAVPSVEVSLLLDCLMEADHLGDLITLSILGDLDAVVEALEEITELAGAPQELEQPEAIQSLQAYFDSPTPALASRLPALERFSTSRRFQEIKHHLRQFAGVRAAFSQIQRLVELS